MFELSKFSLEGRSALVTGGGRGIGKAIALGFAKAGARVVVSSRKADDLESTVAEIKGFGREAVAVPAHLGKTEEVNRMVDTVTKTFGRIDILVNNAGTNPAKGTVLESDERIWETTMNLNARGLYFISQKVAQNMKQNGGGSIINISSLDGFRPEPFLSVYSASKAAVRMITKAFASELAQYRIRVNSIAPGAIRTKMFRSNWSYLSPEDADKQVDEMGKCIPIGRVGEPDDIVGAAIYLASDASLYTTGAEIVIDGGTMPIM